MRGMGCVRVTCVPCSIASHNPHHDRENGLRRDRRRSRWTCRGTGARPRGTGGHRARSGRLDRQPYQLAQLRGHSCRPVLSQGLVEGALLRERQADVVRLLHQPWRAAQQYRKNHRRRHRRGNRHAENVYGKGRSERRDSTCAGCPGRNCASWNRPSNALPVFYPLPLASSTVMRSCLPTRATRKTAARWWCSRARSGPGEVSDDGIVLNVGGDEPMTIPATRWSIAADCSPRMLHARSRDCRIKAYPRSISPRPTTSPLGKAAVPAPGLSGGKQRPSWRARDGGSGRTG